MTLDYGRRWATATGAALMLALTVCAVGRAQSTSAPAAKPAGQTGQPAQAVKHPARKHKAKAQPEPAAVVEPPHPPDPPPPDWPVNDAAQRAQVEWNGTTLKIAATNSSLEQILNDVATATGLKVQKQGSAGADQRVYGRYGPATARDVLAQLLEGSGYNVLMIGDRGEGTPRELVLTAKSGGKSPAQAGDSAQDGQNAGDESNDEPEQPEQPEQPDPNQIRRPPGFPPQVNGQTREQIMQQMQNRQMIQQQQPDQPQPQPQNQ